MIFEVMAVVEECRGSNKGAVADAMMLFEMTVTSYLFFSCDCWINVGRKTIDKLNELYFLFFRQLLACGRGAPVRAMFWFLGALLPENKIISSKILLAFHLINLPKGAVAKNVYEEERRLQLPDGRYTK